MSSLDLIDDSTGAMVVLGLTKALSVSDRFSRRFSLLVESDVTLEESDGEVTIYVAPQRGGTGRKEKVLGFAQELETLLPRVHKHGQGEDEKCAPIIFQDADWNYPGPQFKHACDVLWDAMLCFLYTNIDQIVKRIMQLFKDVENKYAELCERLLGVNDVDEGGSQLDFELGNEVIKLCHATLEYDTSFKAANKLVQGAAKMAQSFEFLVERLLGLFQSQCGRKLYELVCELGALQRAYDTFVRMARSSTSFAKVTIQVGRVR